MTENDKILSLDESTLIQHLIAGKSVSEAARLLGISDKTARRWLDRPHVAAAHIQMKEDISEHVREQIKALSTKAIKALEESLALQDAPTVRLKAAQLVLDRVAPEELKVAAAQPVQGSAGLIAARLLQYLSNEELQQIEQLTTLAEQRAQQAEQDRETLERKRM